MKPRGGHGKPSLGSEQTVNLLDELLQESKLYSSSQRYKQLLDFVVRLRNFAPFNAMLLNIQKPGLSYAAYAKDWIERFGRTPKPTARPLLILRPFGPVALVYDVMDTEGAPIPGGAFGFYAVGDITDFDMLRFCHKVQARGIKIIETDHGGFKAGQIQSTRTESAGKVSFKYELQINRNHEAAARFSTLIHELAHLFLGHIGGNPDLKIPERSSLGKDVKEIEAESVSYLVCRRSGVEPNSSDYLSRYFRGESQVTDFAIHEIMNASGRIETELGLDEMHKHDQDHLAKNVSRTSDESAQSATNAVPHFGSVFPVKKQLLTELEEYQEKHLLRCAHMWFEQSRIRYMQSANLVGYKGEDFERVGRARDCGNVDFTPLFKPLRILMRRYNSAYYTDQIDFLDDQQDSHRWDRYFNADIMPLFIGNLAIIKSVLQAVSLLPEETEGEAFAWLVEKLEDAELPEPLSKYRSSLRYHFLDKKLIECFSPFALGQTLYISTRW